jgi:hypothetical protein
MLTSSHYRQAIIALVAELFPPEDQDRWMLTLHSAINADRPVLAMQKGNNEEAVYRLLLRSGRGGGKEGVRRRAQALEMESESNSPQTK